MLPRKCRVTISFDVELWDVDAAEDNPDFMEDEWSYTGVKLKDLTPSIVLDEMKSAMFSNEGEQFSRDDSPLGGFFEEGTEVKIDFVEEDSGDDD
ncbi:unnamed protein product [Sphagnum jensenii]